FKWVSQVCCHLFLSGRMREVLCSILEQEYSYRQNAGVPRLAALARNDTLLADPASLGMSGFAGGDPGFEGEEMVLHVGDVV
ncbi:hypothetical protein C1Y14_34550, partial [Pseudomonas sp. MPR-R5B]